MAFFAVTAYLTKHTPNGYNYQLMLNVVEAADRQAARSIFAIKAKDDLPDHGLQDVLAVEIDPTPIRKTAFEEVIVAIDELSRIEAADASAFSNGVFSLAAAAKHINIANGLGMAANLIRRWVEDAK